MERRKWVRTGNGEGKWGEDVRPRAQYHGT